MTFVIFIEIILLDDKVYTGCLMQKKRLILLFVLGFLLVFGYSFARNSIDSLFLAHHSSETLPKVWLVTALASFFVISVYNYYNQKYSILNLYKIISIICFFILLLLMSLYYFNEGVMIIILYVWKEIYMVVLMETFWSFADIVFSTKIARFTYGSAMAVCSLGGILGNLSVGYFAKNFGTFNALYLVVFLLLIGYLLSYIFNYLSDDKPKTKNKSGTGIGISTVVNSKYLVPMAILVLNVQIVIGLIDYSFNTGLQENYINIDARTAVFGHVHAAMNGLSIFMQLLLGPFLKIFGISGAFISIPGMLGLSMVMFFISPQFFLMLVVRVLSKSLDYSWLRGVKEILYIPLSREEKTQGKGLIDIFIYRFARGISSIILLTMMAMNLSQHVMNITFLLVIAWFILALVIGKRYKHVVH